MQFMGSQSPGGDTTFNQPADTQESFAPVAQDTPFVQENPVVEVPPHPLGSQKSHPDRSNSSFLPAGSRLCCIAPAYPGRARQDPAPPPSTGKDQTWLVMLYQDADDKVLEQDIFVDLNEAERVGSTDRCRSSPSSTATAAATRATAIGSAKRYYVTQDDDLTAPFQTGGRPGRGQHGGWRHAGRFRHLGDADLPGGQVRADPFGPRHGLARRLDRRRETRSAAATRASR